MGFKVSKEFIMEAHRAACPDWKSRIKSEFPEAFKPQFEVNKWYKIDESIFYCTEIDRGLLFGYGVFDGIWKEYVKGPGACACNEVAAEDRLREATEYEVSAMLKMEAERIGYKEGMTITWKSKPHLTYKLEGNDFKYLKVADALTCGKHGIFQRGEWATILSEEKTTISIEKVLKILAKKLKVSPDSIEIKYL